MQYAREVPHPAVRSFAFLQATKRNSLRTAAAENEQSETTGLRLPRMSNQAEITGHSIEHAQCVLESGSLHAAAALAQAARRSARTRGEAQPSLWCGPRPAKESRCTRPSRALTMSAPASDQSQTPAEVRQLARLASAGNATPRSPAQAGVASLSFTEDGRGEVLDIVWENQRKRPGSDYRAENLSASSDRPAFCNAEGEACAPYTELELGPGGSVPWDPAAGSGWEWMSEWVVDSKNTVTDANGWTYAPRFAPALAGWAPTASMTRNVRRRRWLRQRAQPTAAASASDSDARPSGSLPRTRTSAEDVRKLAPDFGLSPRFGAAPPSKRSELSDLWGQLDLLASTSAELGELVERLETIDPQPRRRAVVMAKGVPSRTAGALAAMEGVRSSKKAESQHAAPYFPICSLQARKFTPQNDGVFLFRTGSLVNNLIEFPIGKCVHRTRWR
eukprot:COSAG05_NODE_49_length_24373_cov_16.162561_7_plen_447_part_00